MKNVPDLTDMTFGQRVAALASYGVGALAAEHTHEIEQAPSIKRVIAEAAKRMKSQNKVRRGRHIAENNPCPDEVAALLQRAEQHLAMREIAIGAGEEILQEGTEMSAEEQQSLEELAEEADEADEEVEIEMVAERIAAELE